MRRLLPLFTAFIFFYSCKDKAVDPSLRVRPVRLQISVSDGNYNLSWEPIRFICIGYPCPDVADVEAEEYEVEVASQELGTFHTYKILSADRKSISIPVSGQGAQLVARIVSKAKGVLPVNSTAVMATNGFLSKSASYPGFGNSEYTQGGDVTPDGTKATYYVFSENKPGEYKISFYLAEMEYERPVSSKFITLEAGISKFSFDGRQIAYHSRTENGLVIYDISSEQKRTIPVVDAGNIRALDWSPDGKWLAFSTVSEESSRLWKIPTSGGSAIPLSPLVPNHELNSIRAADIDWSPDGRFIAVSSTRGRSDEKLWRTVVSFYSPDGSGIVRYFDAQPGWIDSNPAFSPDGKQIAFLSTRTEPTVSVYSLWVRELATGKARRIELLPGLVPSNDFSPHWSGNERLLFVGTLQKQRGYFGVVLD